MVGTSPPSVYLIQARFLLALYDYMNGRPDDGFDSLAGCARMAYAAGIHRSNQTLLSQRLASNLEGDSDSRPQAEEVANTWWGIVICERYGVYHLHRATLS